MLDRYIGMNFYSLHQGKTKQAKLKSSSAKSNFCDKTSGWVHLKKCQLGLVIQDKRNEETKKKISGNYRHNKEGQNWSFLGR